MHRRFSLSLSLSPSLSLSLSLSLSPRFLVVIVIYSMYSRQDILDFAFATFDKDGSGTIDEGEFIDLARMITAGEPNVPCSG